MRRGGRLDAALQHVPQSPYNRYNLRRNPFGELTRAERAELAVVDTARWLDELSRPATALQFVAPCGYGKTTHLLALARDLPRAAYIYLPEAGPRPTIPRTRPLMIDEAQRLGWRERRCAFRLGGPLVLGTHRNLEPWLRRAGLVVITVDVGSQQTPERLERMLNRRIEASRLAASGPIPCIDRQFACALLDQFGFNTRRIEHYLYDQFQDAARKALTWPPVI
jgi:hypothetical protein